MKNFRTTLTVCSLFAMTSAAWQCGGGNTQNAALDLSQPSVDMAASQADLTTFSTPAITSVSPPAGPNAGGTAITISGTGFLAGATVKVGGVACTQVSVTSATTITCTTPGLAAFCGPVTVTVTNPDQQAANRVNGFSYRSASVGFAAAKNIPNNGTASRDAVWADFNNDGKNDIVNANGAAANNLTIQLGNGDGTFTSKGIDLGSGNVPAALAAADLNNDGAQDLAVLINAAGAQPQLLVMLGQKDGTFKPRGAGINLTAGSTPTAVAVGTADNKVKPYVVVSSTIGGKAAIEEYTNDGTGNLINQNTTIYGATGTNSSHLALADGSLT